MYLLLHAQQKSHWYEKQLFSIIMKIKRVALILLNISTRIAVDVNYHNESFILPVCNHMVC